MAVIALREPKGHVAAQVTASNAGHQTTTSPSPKKSAKPSATNAKSGRSSADRQGNAGASSSAGTSATSVPLIVLNNTTTSGLAQQAAQQFEGAGWTVTRYGNYQNDILSTCAYYDPSVPGAEAAARSLQQQFPAIKRVKERFAQLPEGPVVVVLTPDYSTG